MLQCEVKSAIPAYSGSCREASLIEAGIFRFPNVQLTRLEQDASVSKYLNKPLKRQRPRARPARYSSGATLSSESDSSADDSCSSEYVISDDESVSSDDSVTEVPRVSSENECYSTTESTKTSSNPGVSTTESLSSSKNLKQLIVKLTRLENDENCFKYLNQNFRTEMPSKTTHEEKLEPIVIVSNLNIHGKHKTSFRIKKHGECEETSNSSEESKDSCYTSDCSHSSNSEKMNRFNCFDTAKSLKHTKECSITLTKLKSNIITNLKSTIVRKLSRSSDSTPIEIDLTSDTSSVVEGPFVIESEDSEDSSVEEPLAVTGCRENRTLSIESNSNFSESVTFEDDSSTSDEIMRCFEPQASQSSESNSRSTVTEETSSSAETNMVENDKTKVDDSGIGIMDDATVSQDSYYIKSTRFLPYDGSSDASDREECFIIDLQFVNDEEYEQWLLEMNNNNAVKDDYIEATCDLCNDSFTSRSTLYRHMEKIHNCTDYFECKYCGELFSVKACLVFHLFAQLSGDYEKAFETHTCSQYLCSKKDFTDSELEFLKKFCSNHAALHSQLLKSEITDQNQNCTLAVGEVIPSDVTADEPCPLEIQKDPCNGELSSKEDEKNECTESALTCSVNQKSKRGRLKRKSKSIGRPPKKSRNDGDFVCEVCNEDCESKKRLFDHFTNNHDHIYYFECHSCDKLFQNSISLSSHFSKKECIKKKLKNLMLKCEICGNTYKNPSTLRKHKMNLHNLFVPAACNYFIKCLANLPLSETDLNCLYCYDSYSNPLLLLDHERDSHNYYSCFEPLCSESFFSRSDFERHLFLHFTNGESSFCNFCSQLFFTKQYLEAHIQKHLQNVDDLFSLD